jgi:hypothetical protein
MEGARPRASRRGFFSVEGILGLAMDARFGIGIALELPAAQFWRYGGWVIPSGIRVCMRGV